MNSSYFLASNSAFGFHSLYDELRDGCEKMLIIKAGPGCGKSTFMRRVAKNMTARGLSCEYVHCSSDPDSLDALIVPEKGLVIADGTSPHVIEPKYPLAVESYLDLSKFADADAISEARDEIISVSDAYRDEYQSAYQYISCMGNLYDECYRLALRATDIEKLIRRANSLAEREIKGRGGKAGIKSCFNSAISSAGFVSLYDNCPHTIVIDDSFGLSHIVLEKLRDFALKRDMEVICSYNPLKPTLLSNLFIKEVPIAFVTRDKNNTYPYPYMRKIHLDGAVDIKKLKSERYKFVKKLYRIIEDEAYLSLGRAKALHDRLEKIYNPHIDFDALMRYADEVSESL